LALQSNSPSASHITEKQGRVRTAQGWANLNRHTGPDQSARITRYGEPMVSPRAWFELVMEEAIKKNPSLHDVTWHIFRHTYISRLVMAGVDLRTVQELAGHKDIKMTTRYAHLAPSHKLAAVDRLAEHRRMQELGETTQTAV
jgi:site-specific recombinase XerD